jgi:hypothetical protein
LLHVSTTCGHHMDLHTIKKRKSLLSVYKKNFQSNLTTESWHEHYSSITDLNSKLMHFTQCQKYVTILLTVYVSILLNVFCKIIRFKLDVLMFRDKIRFLRQHRNAACHSVNFSTPLRGSTFCRAMSQRTAASKRYKQAYVCS